MRTIVPMLAMLLATCACAATADRPPAKPRSAEEVRRYCEDQMYINRSTDPRSAPNWNLYYRCIRKHRGR